MDIDIDFRSDFDPLEYFSIAIRASMVEKDELKKHPAGVYLQDIPRDKITNLAAIPYKQAEELGYLKVDFLHLSLLDIFESKKEIRHLLKKEPDWTMLEDQETVEKLFQIHRHFDIISKVKPKCVDDIADVLAFIRPPKRYLLDTYLNCRTNDEKQKVREILYTKPDRGIWFKKPHSIAYALNIVLQLHLIKAKII